MSADTNPYRPPTAEVDLLPDAGEGPPLAGKWRRFATLVLDYVGYYIVAVVAGIVMGILFGARALVMLQGVNAYIFGFVLYLGYYLFFEGLWARTPAKLILGTVVTDLQGRPPTFTTILKRTLARCLPFEWFTFFGTAGFHDEASRTRVVRTR